MQRLWLAIIAISVLFAGGLEAEAARPLWQKFVPKKQVTSAPDGDYSLSKENGPWLILAASFNGEAAEQQARDLVHELRKDFGLPAYYYGMTFQMDDANPGRGLDIYGARIQRKYQRSRIREHAVLVGEFPSLDDSKAQKLLKRIKQMSPKTMSTESSEAGPVIPETVQQVRDYFREKVGNGTNKKGAMGYAFLTRNPLLPKEYFVPQGVEEDIAKWNEDLKYTLMKCPGKYSIRVATFKGRSSLKKAGETIEKAKTRKASQDDPLVLAGKKAHKLVVALRAKGWEAYEFHDRHESYVTIGSFDNGQTLADGRIVISHRNAQIITDTFGAHTPNNVLNRPAPEDQRLEAKRKQQFNSLFAGGNRPVATGFHPKRFVGMPLDIQPKVVSVPRRSISSVYARK